MSTSIIFYAFQLIVVILLNEVATGLGDTINKEPLSTNISPQYGCIERRTITVLFYGERSKIKLMTQMLRFFHRNLIEKTSSGFTIHVYLGSRQQTILLRDDTETYNQMEAGLPVTSSQHIIEDYLIHGPASTPDHKQTILYIAMTSDNQTDAYHQLDLLQKQKHWDVLVACNPSVCPTSRWIAINRVLPYETSRQWLRNTLGLLQNPDYNRFDSYLATAPAMGQRRCKPSSSKWRSINIIVHDFKGNYLASAINSELLINTQQQQQKQRKIVFYAEEADKTPQQFWRYYLKANGLDHMIRVLSYSLYDIEQLVIPRNFEKVKNDIFVAIGDF